MKRMLIASFIVAVATGAWLQSADTPVDAEAKSKTAVKEIVAGLFKNWEEGKATKSADAFVNEETPVANVWHFHKVNTRQRKAIDFLSDMEKDAPKYLKLDATDVDVMDAGFAVAKLKYTGSGYKGRAVATLVNDGKAWRIAALSFHDYFNW